MLPRSGGTGMTTPSVLSTSQEELRKAREAITKPGREELRIAAEGLLKNCTLLSQKLTAGASVDELMKSAKNFAGKETTIYNTKKSLSATGTFLFAMDGHSDLIFKSCNALEDTKKNLAGCSRGELVKHLQRQCQ